MNVPIWPGSSSFSPGNTPFGFYDNETDFQTDADKFSTFASRRLGYPLVEIELQDVNFYAAFEEAITTYGNEVYASKVADDLLSYEGSPTTIQPGNKELVNPNFANLVLLSNQYGEEAGVGGNVTYYSGSLKLEANKQDYDLTQWAIDNNIEGGIEIKRIYYEAPPAINRYFDPYVGSGTGMMQMLDGFGWGGYSPAINFMLMPISYDMQTIQAIEFNDQIRKSQYTFELVNNQLKIFPIPRTSGMTDLWFQYIKLDDRNQPYVDRHGKEIITNVSNVPFENPNYNKINSIGRQWVFEYALALTKEILGYVRGKYSTVPIPGADMTLNQDALISAATSEKERLIEKLRTYLESTSREKLLEKKANEAEQQNKTMGQAPMNIFIG
jgi:hypothetical protein|tara:strand:+ start:42 stop:1193 length:1152 start_codon:yes stop_codon:yes gene_type:complete